MSPLSKRGEYSLLFYFRTSVVRLPPFKPHSNIDRNAKETHFSFPAPFLGRASFLFEDTPAQIKTTTPERLRERILNPHILFYIIA